MNCDGISLDDAIRQFYEQAVHLAHHDFMIQLGEDRNIS